MKWRKNERKKIGPKKENDEGKNKEEKEEKTPVLGSRSRFCLGRSPNVIIAFIVEQARKNVDACRHFFQRFDSF